jgi:drug/metabolite transporter (DMT)-like permease
LSDLVNVTVTSSTTTARHHGAAETAAFSTLALLCFAANSVLCRVALRDGAIDPASFSSIRIASGTVMLLLVASWTRGAARETAKSWMSAVMLFLYAVPFSFAYTRLTTGTGALILFGAVQITMLAAAEWSGERLRAMQWLGVTVALAGLVYLVSPGLTAPPLFGATLMGMAGFSWGIYSLRGRGLANPLAQTTTNFTRATPMVLVVSLIALSQVHVEPRGIVFAIASGAVASGLGYVAWYAALRGLTATRAAVLQLSVPVLAAAGGVVFLTEPISLRLIVSAMLVIGGIALTLAHR